MCFSRMFSLLFSPFCVINSGVPRRDVQDGIVWIRAEARPADTLLERITVRNYHTITDITLRHLAECAPNLRALDVSGTNVTAEGVRIFRQNMPLCEVIADDLLSESGQNEVIDMGSLGMFIVDTTERPAMVQDGLKRISMRESCRQLGARIEHMRQNDMQLQQIREQHTLMRLFEQTRPEHMQQQQKEQEKREEREKPRVEKESKMDVSIDDHSESNDDDSESDND